MRKFNCSLLILSTFFFCYDSSAQVREIKQRSNSYNPYSSYGDSYRSNSSSSAASSSSLGEALAGQLIMGIVTLPFQVAFRAHEVQATKFHSDPWRVSLESHLKMGMDFNENTTLINPMIRANYGLFSSQLRYSRISDVSGGFATLDWQILQLNLLNNEYTRLIAGFGVSNEISQNVSHPEGLIEFSVFLADRSIIPTVVYRSSGGGHPRKEWSSKISYRPFPSQKFSSQFSLGYTYQRWYELPIHFISAGIGFVFQ